ncbi:NAD+ synthase [Occultella kanbiaonis]|uniref:NAD+ synthase n=1 Tax=Occultella kanbiaonis TaxID=2675754 RepID=UPI0013D05AF4|nr:NAD+ synthase [Occultella kanbiaonis]
MTTLRVALAQTNSTVGDLGGNAATVLRVASAAAAEGADLIAFGEMMLTGYPIEDLAVRGSFQRAAAARLAALAGDLVSAGAGDAVVVVGALGTAADGRPTNTAVVLHQGRIVTRYTKHHLPNYGVFDEFRIFASGNDSVVVDVAGKRVGLAICEDIWQDGGTVEQLTDDSLDLLLVINGSPYERGKAPLRVRLGAQRAREVGAPVAYVNLIGGQDDLVFDGGSFVVDVDGELLASGPTFVEHLLVLDIDTPGQTVVRDAAFARRSDDTEQMYDAVVLGLRDYALKNGFGSVVLGLSGGIDSALVAAIAADAVGASHVVGVSMPSVYSSSHSRTDAEDTAERIGLDYRVQEIAPMVDAFQGALGLSGTAEENLQARVRGVILMALSNTEGHLVLATGNKSELAVGYSTIYGDAVGGYAPLKDVSKTRVWELSRFRNARALDRGEVEPIPENSITKPPSAELRPGQRDDQSLPDYALLDNVLDAYVENALGREDLLASGFDEETVETVVSLVDRAEWKRRQYPIGPKVTAMAFGRDRRLPITSAFRESDAD